MVTENVDNTQQLAFGGDQGIAGAGIAEPVGPTETVEPDIAPQPEGELAGTEPQAPPPAPTPIGTPYQPSPQAAPPVAPEYSPEQLAKMQADAAQYEQVRMRAALQNEADNYKAQLEARGFLPEHAEEAANYYAQSQQQQMQVMQRAEEYGKHIQGKQMAAEHFVKKYGLAIDDFAELRRYEDPASMDQAAQKLSKDRQRDAELAQFKQSRVPPQALDNSQGNPEVAANEGGWLDRYNSGDRSPNAVAAGRRAAGLQ
jgi:hypothetical protein